LLALLLSGEETMGVVSVADVFGLRPEPPHRLKPKAAVNKMAPANRIPRDRRITVLSIIAKKTMPASFPYAT
jgi:hypothetical protein